MNARGVLALRGGAWQAITWAGITVGDILQVGLWPGPLNPLTSDAGTGLWAAADYP